MGNGTLRLVNLAEVCVVFLLREYVATIALAAALAAGITLPSMPVLKYTYLVFVLVVLLLIWLKARGEKWSDFGLIVPVKWGRYLAFGVLLTVVSIVFDSALRSVTTPLIVKWTGANPHLDAETFAALKGDLPLTLMFIASAWVFAALGEEVLFRGYLLNRIAQVLGGGRAAWAVAIVGQGIAFGLAHSYQGPVGMVPIAFGAMLSGIASVAWGRNLWPAIIAHGLVDTLGVTMLYLGLPIS